MKNFVVGQKVWMRAGEQLEDGTVIEISDFDHYRIEVEPAKPEQMADFGRRFALHFRENGQQCGLWLYLGDTYGWVENDPRPLCFNHIPWRLVL